MAILITDRMTTIPPCYQCGEPAEFRCDDCKRYVCGDCLPVLEDEDCPNEFCEECLLKGGGK